MKAPRRRFKLQNAFQKQKGTKKAEQTGTNFERLNGAVYQLIGEKCGRTLPIFKDLNLNLQRTGLKINFKAYVNLTVFSTLIATVLVAVGLPIVLGAGFAFKNRRAFNFEPSLGKKFPVWV